MPCSEDAPLTFQQAVTEITKVVITGLQTGGEALDGLNHFSDCVYLKNEEGTLTCVNQAYRVAFSANESPIGRHAKTFLDPTVFSTSTHTDALILSGSDHLECDHTGTTADGKTYLLRTHKRSLRGLRQPGFAILGITRLLRALDDGNADPRAHMASLAQSFRALEDRDQELCRLIGQGLSSAEIGEQLGMTARNVDLRRKKAFEALGVNKPIELVRELVRLQERGYLDLGL